MVPRCRLHADDDDSRILEVGVTMNDETKNEPETEETEGNCFKGGAPSTVEGDDTDGNAFRSGAPSTVESDDTDGQAYKYGGVTPAGDDEKKDDTDGNSVRYGG